jgi:folate-dependent phosphoribosylglycinamide formyltransferase PurN
MSTRLAVFASGGGSNLQALLDRFNSNKESPVRVKLVVSDRPTPGRWNVRAKPASTRRSLNTAIGRTTSSLEKCWAYWKRTTSI